MSRPPDVLAPIRRTACGSPNVLHMVLVGPLNAFALLTVAVALEIRAASISLKSLTYRCIRMCERMKSRYLAHWRLSTRPPFRSLSIAALAHSSAVAWSG